MTDAHPDPRPAREWPIPPMDHGSGHKDTAFTWAMGNLILARIIEGETMKAITADPRMPAYCTVFRWMQVVPEFADAVRQVRAALATNRLNDREAHRLARGPKRRSGRKSTYSDLTGEIICDAIAQGASLSEIVARPGMPSFKAIYTWLRDQPQFREVFIEACDHRDRLLAFQAEAAIEEVFEIGIPAAQAKINALKARAGRLRPKLYRASPLGD
jgi:terminase small subunit-like protein